MPLDSEVRARIAVVNAGVEFFTDSDSPTWRNAIPCREWSVTDDVLNVADSASVLVSNIDGENAGRFSLGQKVHIQLSDPAVRNGKWTPQFTGRITNLRTGSGSAGSYIQVSMMDLGWHLTSCHAPPLTNLNGVTYAQLLKKLIDPTWGFGKIVTGANLNTRIKQGRVGAERALQTGLVQYGQILPYIQVEPGQAPFEILQPYAARDGLLINVGPGGELILFTPDYTRGADYFVSFHPATRSDSAENVVLDEPTVSESIDGLYNEVQCWSTSIMPIDYQSGENQQNMLFRKFVYKPDFDVLPFNRRHVFSDGDAITPQMRKNRAVYKQQLGAFQSWTYEVELQGVSQGGAFFTSNSMIAVRDTQNGVLGVFYVQSVQKSLSTQGTRTKFVIRKPLLDPVLNRFIGSGAKRTAATVNRPTSTTTVVRPGHSGGPVSTVTIPKVQS